MASSLILFLAVLPLVLVVALAMFNHRKAISGIVDEQLTQPARRLFNTKEHVDALAALVGNCTFVGSAAGVLFGLGSDTPEASHLGAALALGAVFVLMKLSKHSVDLGTRDAAMAHRKMAGTMRSIVRSELAAAQQKAAARTPRKPRRETVRTKRRAPTPAQRSRRVRALGRAPARHAVSRRASARRSLKDEVLRPTIRRTSS